MPSPGGSNSRDNYQVQAEPQAQTPAYLTLYTYPCSSQPSQNEPQPVLLIVKAIDGSWTLSSSLTHAVRNKWQWLET